MNKQALEQAIIDTQEALSIAIANADKAILQLDMELHRLERAERELELDDEEDML
jgi:hypothetical protein|tara:strand:- start:319 stop:483 length:165 start_codon:yes stop_codon:yes gene_type:complete